MGLLSWALSTVDHQEALRMNSIERLLEPWILFKRLFQLQTSEPSAATSCSDLASELHVKEDPQFKLVVFQWDSFLLL